MFRNKGITLNQQVEILELLFYLPSVRLYLGAYSRITNTKWIKSSGSYQPLKLCFVSNTASVLHRNNVHINIHEWLALTIGCGSVVGGLCVNILKLIVICKGSCVLTVP